VKSGWMRSPPISTAKRPAQHTDLVTDQQLTDEQRCVYEALVYRARHGDPAATVETIINTAPLPGYRIGRVKRLLRELEAMGLAERRRPRPLRRKPRWVAARG